MSTSNEKNAEILSLPLEQLIKRIAEFKEEGDSISIDNRLLLRQMIRKMDKTTSPVESSKVFVGERDKEENRLSFIDIDKIFSCHNEDSPMEGELNDRLNIDRASIVDLSESIDKLGLIQPIVVQDMGDGTFRKVTGWRRIEASKLLGRKKIKAIVRNDNFDLDKHNLSILHENTQRVDLNDYEKISAVFHLMKRSFGITDDIEMRKIFTQSNNLNKKNLKHPTEEIKRNLEKIKLLINESKVYSSLSHLVKHLNILDMNKKIVSFLAQGNISFKTAEKLHSAKKLNWKSPWSYELIITAIGEDSLTLEKAIEFISDNSTNKKETKNNVGTLMLKMKKGVSSLEKTEKEDFEKELAAICSKYFTEK